MDLLEEKYPTKKIYGIDISSNVIETLEKKKLQEQKKWNLVKGDALNLNDYFEIGSLDTIIYSSIIHELYSYIPFEGKKFNINTVIKALKSAYSILPVNGRIIIRDGIKTEPVDQERIIEFKNIEDLSILKRYCNDFKGREIKYERINDNKVKMLVNDAMEFLYTYTWGEDSYPLEVQEQFGYLTPTEYVKLIQDNLENSMIVKCTAFLQEGYEENLLNKIAIYDENMNVVKLPNSTCIIVIEKTK
jgi:SAM-dependent methyltransferase